MTENLNHNGPTTWVDVREFESPDGRLWLELFPYVFAPVDSDAEANWGELQLLNPATAGLVFTGHGPDSAYKAPQTVFFRGLNMLVDSVDWLRDERFDFEEGSSFAKLLGMITVGRSHDPIGALWIDRLKWIDENVENFAENSVDSLRRMDFERNRKIMHEVNWLSVLFNPSRANPYPRDFTTDELVDYEIDIWSVEFARRFPKSNADWEKFFQNQCENSILRDICEAHIFFERTLDPSPQHVLKDVGGYFGGRNRRDLRDRRISLLNLNASLQIDAFMNTNSLDDLNFKQFWMHEEQTLIPSTVAALEEEVRSLVEFLLGNSSTEHFGQWRVHKSFLAGFALDNPEMFSEQTVERMKSLFFSDYGPDWMAVKAQWVFDEIMFRDFQPTFNPTGTQVHPSMSSMSFPIHRGIFEAEAVVALSEFLTELSPDSFENWVNSPNALFENGFRNLEDFQWQSMAIMEAYWDAAGYQNSE